MSDDYGQDAQAEAWAHELMQERYRLNVEALNRCAAAGARIEDIRRLAAECGIEAKHIQIRRTDEPQ